MTPEQRDALLRLARRSLVHEVCGGQRELDTTVELPAGFSGCFVTLKTAGRLRGCMGTFRPLGTLAQTVDQVTRMSCSSDPRFASQRIGPDELDEIHIEVSVLDEPKPTDDPAGLVVGKHGVWIRRGSASGCLLPQVAVERGWSAEEFLTQCCVLKAGLTPDAWRDPETETLLFGAEIISEPPRGSAGAGSAQG
jgi:AmmeMemoRadiSam system protein A